LKKKKGKGREGKGKHTLNGGRNTDRFDKTEETVNWKKRWRWFSPTSFFGIDSFNNVARSKSWVLIRVYEKEKIFKSKSKQNKTKKNRPPQEFRQKMKFSRVDQTALTKWVLLADDDLIEEQVCESKNGMLERKKKCKPCFEKMVRLSISEYFWSFSSTFNR